MYVVPFANAQKACINLDQISKWEVLDGTKALAYDPQGSSLAFVIFDPFAPLLKKSGENFRFFSPSVCPNDRVQVSGGMKTVQSIEPIRK